MRDVLPRLNESITGKLLLAKSKTSLLGICSKLVDYFTGYTEGPLDIPKIQFIYRKNMICSLQYKTGFKFLCTQIVDLRGAETKFPLSDLVVEMNSITYLVLCLNIIREEKILESIEVGWHCYPVGEFYTQTTIKQPMPSMPELLTVPDYPDYISPESTSRETNKYSKIARYSRLHAPRNRLLEYERYVETIKQENRKRLLKHYNLCKEIEVKNLGNEIDAKLNYNRRNIRYGMKRRQKFEQNVRIFTNQLTGCLDQCSDMISSGACLLTIQDGEEYERET